MYLYQPFWEEFTGNGDEPDYKNIDYSRKLFRTHEKALAYAKKWKHKHFRRCGCSAGVRELEVIEN